MSGRLVHELEYHYSDMALLEMVHTRILRSAIMKKWINSLSFVSLIFQKKIRKITILVFLYNPNHTVWDVAHPWGVTSVFKGVHTLVIKIQKSIISGQKSILILKRRWLFPVNKKLFFYQNTDGDTHFDFWCYNSLPVKRQQTLKPSHSALEPRIFCGL